MMRRSGQVTELAEERGRERNRQEDVTERDRNFVFTNIPQNVTSIRRLCFVPGHCLSQEKLPDVC
jgi:hypothetical protein